MPSGVGPAVVVWAEGYHSHKCTSVVRVPDDTSGGTVRDPYAPVRGKCTWWREVPNDADSHDRMLKASDRRVDCSCFVEGSTWTYKESEVPAECPQNRSCRYYIKGA